MLDISSSPVNQEHDKVMATPAASTQCQPAARWDRGVNSPTTNKGLTVTKLKTRPKTSSAANRQTSLKYVHGSKCLSQSLGDRLSQCTPCPNSRERPNTSVTRGKDKERGSATWVKEKSGYVVMKGKELPLPICTTQERKATGTEEILSITTKLRNRSAAGSRSVASIIGSNTRGRSAALLRELSLSLSSRIGLSSPFRDCLKERWRYISKESPLYNITLGRDPCPSPSKNPLCLEGNDEEVSNNSLESSRCQTPLTDRSRALSILKDLKDKFSGPSSPSKDPEEATRISESREHESTSKTVRRASAKRSHSTGSMLQTCAGGLADSCKSPRQDWTGSGKKELMMTSPRIITINRIPTPTGERDTRSAAQDRVKFSPKNTSCLSISDPSLSVDNQDVLLQPKTDELHAGVKCVMTLSNMALTSVKHTPRSNPRSPRALGRLPKVDQALTFRDDTIPELCILQDQQICLVRSDSDFVGHCRPVPYVNSGIVQESQVCSSRPKSTHKIITQEELTAVMKADVDTVESRGEPETNGQDQVATSVTFHSPRSRNLSEVDEEDAEDEEAETSEDKAIRIPCEEASPDDSDCSSSTPTVPFSSADLLYGNGEGAGPSHPAGATHGAADEVACGDVGAWDHRSGDKQKLKELDLQGNKRPVSRSSSNKKAPSFEKVSYDRDREELRPITNAVPTTKQPLLRANGIKNNLLRPDQYLCQRTNGTTGREEDLVAMGTLWSPSQLQTRGSSTTTTSSGKSTSAPASGSGAANFAPTAAAVPVRRPANLATNTSSRQLLQHTSALANPSMGNVIKSNKEVEPKYSDPLTGATPTFQQRLMELAALEAETVRWERSKKVKKKPSKQDRDS